MTPMDTVRILAIAVLVLAAAGSSLASEPPLIYESSYCRYDMKLDAKRLVWSGKKRVKERYVVKTTAGLDASRFVLNKNRLIDIGKVKARIERHGKWRDIELVMSEMSPWFGYPGFSDEIVRGYAIPDLHLGDRVELEYEQRYDGIWEIPRHVFGGFEPKAQETLEIHVPQEVVLAVHVTKGLVGGPEIIQSRRDEGNKQILLWEAHDWPGLNGPEPEAPSFYDLMPAVFVAACSLRLDEKETVPVRATWADFARWYETRVTPMFELDRDLKAFLEIARHDAQSDEDLMARVYGMVQHRVRYLAYTIGEGGWIPHAASTTYANQYGDCKDMSTLIVALLKGAGIPARLALVQSRSKTTEVHTDFPYSMQFDHCVAYVKIGESDFWMDATGSAPFGDVPSFITAHPALIVDGEETRFVRPAHPDQGEGELRERFVLNDLRRDGGRLQFRFDFRGPLAQDFRQRASEAKPSDLIDWAEAMLRPSFMSVSQLQLEDARPVTSAVLKGECRVPPPGRLREVEAGGEESGFRAWLVRAGITEIKLPTVSLSRKLPYRFDTARAYTSETTVNLPWPAKSDSLVTQIDEPFASFRLEVRTSGQRLESRRQLHWKQEVISVEQLPQFQEFLRAVRQVNDRLWEVRR